jgi:hypothetical protein
MDVPLGTFGERVAEGADTATQVRERSPTGSLVSRPISPHPTESPFSQAQA